MTPDEMARACADKMWADDNASRALGMKIEEISAGCARLSMPVREDMTNGQKICHGGFMFLLADSAFAFACNGYNQYTVAQHCSVTFLKPVYQGDVLTARAREIQRQGRSGIYDVTVIDHDGELVAEFRGHSHSLRRAILDGAP